jgi:hypothetical protein
VTTYLDLFTPETWAAYQKSGGAITGFRASQLRSAEKIQPGDRFLCYLVKLQRWVGVLEVASSVFQDGTPIFTAQDDPFTVRFKVNPLVTLAPEHGIPIYDVWHHLKMCNGIDPSSMGWAYKVGVARSLGIIDPADDQIISDLLNKQSEAPKEFPLSKSERTIVEGKRLVALPSGQTTVEIPTDDDQEKQNTPAQPATEQRRSIKVQAQLVAIGVELGFKVWIPANDRAAVLTNLPAAAAEHVLTQLPLNADDNTVETVERIDVLWVKGRTIARAFEVEHTTSVYSGILRMSDLIALQPQFQIKLHIVAPEERRDKVRQQILRPTFAYMEGGPLATICTFLSYNAIDELFKKPDLRFMKDVIVDEFEEVMD